MKSKRIKIESLQPYKPESTTLKLPKGRLVEESEASVAVLLQKYSQNFKGSIDVSKSGYGVDTIGFILIDNGTVLAAGFKMLGMTLHQVPAMDRMMTLTNTTCEVHELTDEEIRLAIADNPRTVIVMSPENYQGKPVDTAAILPQIMADPVMAPQVIADPVMAPQILVKLDDTALPIAEEVSNQKLLSEYEQLVLSFTSIDGVIGTALVADGFPVYQHGTDVDFEHVAAATEDMVRIGARIATELQLGGTGQIILETPGYKVIIAPVNDMFLCVLTRADTNLGIIRLNINNIQRSQQSGY
ncbi:MAG TPA: roadblock/LC7 domain-containing protein [Methanocella sp.]|nr:roadblock/LC7 domain-containing protein [Methanocella sp.]